MKKITQLFVVFLLLSLVLTSCALPPVSGFDTPDDTIEDDNNNQIPDNKDDTTVGGDETPDNGNETPDDGKDENTLTTSDPYVNMTSEEFYANYTPAKDYMDAYYRTLHGFMSGDLETPDQAPNISDYRPSINGKYVRNNDLKYEDDGNTFILTDAYGNKVKEIYKDGAYITLDEVAAYVYAFGTIPANYTSSKKTKPTASEWGEYLRLNHTKFSGDTQKYPYEPVLPRISGCGGDLTYYEIDIGTTGTDCDPSYASVLYNNGKSITRGAARIVYARFDAYGDNITDPDIRFVFYTYNHYNDFQEYLGYLGGYGEIFGNITGGGTISSKTDYSPTDYIPTTLTSLSDPALFFPRFASKYQIAPALLGKRK